MIADKLIALQRARQDCKVLSLSLHVVSLDFIFQKKELFRKEKVGLDA